MEWWQVVLLLIGVIGAIVDWMRFWSKVEEED